MHQIYLFIHDLKGGAYESMVLKCCHEIARIASAHLKFAHLHI